jgi:putative zinc finger protein
MKLEARENMPHVDEGSLHAYLDGELPLAERAPFVAHLAECAACRIRLDEERALVARAGELLGRAAPPTRQPAPFSAVRRSHSPPWRVPAAWAATVAIAFAVGWYAQGERSADEATERAIQSEAAGPAPTTDSRPAAVAKPKAFVAPRRSSEPASRAPAVAAAPRADTDGQPAAPATAAAPAVAPAAQANTLRDEVDAWPRLDAAGARAVLGRAPALLSGRAVMRMARSPTDAGVVFIEQEWEPGVVLRLYERRAISAELDATRPSPARARLAPSAKMALRSENLARYVSWLRVEIAGPLAADSLAQLLDSVE